jgi:hypothetical protein
MRANTFILQGNAVKKPMVEILQDLVSTLDFSKRAQPGPGAEEKPAEDDDLGIPTDVDFDAASKPAEGTPEGTPEGTGEEITEASVDAVD